MNRRTQQYLREQQIHDRILLEADWVIDNKCSIRTCAKHVLMSKSQVHRDLHALRHIDDDRYVQVKNILKSHMKG